MKKIIILTAALWLSLLCIAQTGTWKAFDNFHNMVSKTLHPIITGNVQPVKQNSGLLLTKVKAWQVSPVPKTVDTAVFKSQIAGLVKQCSDLDEAVKSKQSNAILITKANTVHETFHALLKACNLKD